MKKQHIYHLVLVLLINLNIFITRAQNNFPVSVRVGAVLGMDYYVGEMGLNCIYMALSDFYATNPNYKTRLQLVERDSKGDVFMAAAQGLDLLRNVGVQAIIGPTSSSEATFMTALGDKAQIPIITFSATSPSLSSYGSPYFVRAALSDSSQVKAIGAIVQAYGWREVVLIYEDDVFGEGILPSLVDALEDVNARIPYRIVLPSLATGEQIDSEVYKMMSRHPRVFLVHVLFPLGSLLFSKLKQQEMMSGDYVWIITNGLTYELFSMDPLVLESMQGVIGVRPYTSKTKELDDFRIRYKKNMQQNNPQVISPELNIFGLWAYDAAVALAIAVEKAALGVNFTSLEPNISGNSTDILSFAISSFGPKLIVALTNTSFKGLSGNFEIIDGQLQSPPYEIINVVGRGDRVVGYWTKEKGITKDLSFESAGTKTYSTDKSNFGPIIWPGDKASPPKGWVLPTNGKKLRVGVPVENGFSEFVKVTWNSDNSTTITGLCIEIFDEVMRSLPYGAPYEYIPFATPDHRMAGKYDDLVYQVYLGNFDAVAGDVTIVANRSQHVDFTLPFMESGISMVAPVVDDKRKNGWIFVKPLTWQLWLTTFCSFLFIAFLIWALEYSTNNEDFMKGTRWNRAGTVFWFAFSTMVFAQKEKILSNLSRFVLIVWFLVVLILTQSYTANLASMLTVQRLNPTVKDVDKLINNNIYVGYKKGSFVHDFLKKMKFEDDRLIEFSSPEEMDELFRKGSGNGGIAAAFHEIPYIKIFLAKYCSKYTMAGPTYKADGFGFVFPIGSPLVPDVSRAILNVTEGKTLTEIERNLLSYKEKCPDSESDLDSKEYSLQLKSFKGLFIITSVVGGLALLCRLGQLGFRRWIKYRFIFRPTEISTLIHVLLQFIYNGTTNARE